MLLFLIFLIFLIILFLDLSHYTNIIRNDIPDEYKYKDSRKPIYYDFIPEVPQM